MENTAPLSLRRIDAKDWAWIAHWFADPWLDRALGPMDRAWLEHVLGDRSGVQLVAEDAAGPVGLIGIIWGDSGTHGVTDLAVDPARRGQGLGGRILDAALAWPGHPPYRGWVSYVAHENPAPARLLARKGWAETGSKGGMRQFEKAAQAASGRPSSA